MIIHETSLFKVVSAVKMAINFQDFTAIYIFLVKSELPYLKYRMSNDSTTVMNTILTIGILLSQHSPPVGTLIAKQHK